MQNLETLTVGLTPRMAAEVRKAVEAGEYASAGEVIRDALRLWSAQRRTDADRRGAKGQSEGGRP